MDNKINFKMMRHGEKDFRGRLTIEGAEKAKDKAVDIFEKIEKMPSGSVFCFMTSNIGRARDTKEIIEAEVAEQINKKPEEYAIYDLGREDVLSKVADDSNKKIFLKTEFYDEGIGFKQGDESTKAIASDEAFVRYKMQFDRDETAVGKIWISHNNELEKLNNYLSTITPDMASEKVKPSDLVFTPESLAIKQLEWMKQIKNIASRFFPDRDVNIIAVSHNMNLDFSIMKLLTGSISLKSLNMLGGEMSDYLESSNIKFEGDKIKVAFRGITKEYTDKNIDQIISELKEESKKREEEWKKIK